MIIICVLLTTACRASTGEQLATGNQAFDEAAYDRAAQTYEELIENDPLQAEPIYNLANTLYRLGIYTDTHQLLPQAAVSGSEELATQSYYNQGNAHFQLEDWPAAIDAYKESLRLNPENVDAKYNLELAMRNVTQEDQQQDQQQDSQDQEEQEEEQQDQEEQEQQDQQDQEQQNQEQQEQDQQEQQDSSEESQEESNEAAEDQQSQEGEPQEEESQEGQPQNAEPQEGLTEEQARQLLRAIGQNTETLQEQMQMVLPAEGAPPEKDW